MSFDHLYIRDVEGERRVEADELPLRIGTGSDCVIRLPGPGGGPVVLFDLLDGAPFVQPVGRDDSIAIDGETLTGSRRLGDGDEIQFYGSRVRVSSGGDKLVLQVRLEDSAYVTQPPEQPDAEAAAAEEAIAPTAFRRAAETRAVAPPQKSHPMRWILGVGLSVLAIASWLLFTSKSVQITVVPEDPDSISIAGGWFHLPLGDRILMRPGEYTLIVERSGYYDVNQAFAVGDDEQTKTVAVTMRKLPGNLIVQTIPQAQVTISVDDTHIGPAPLGPVELEPGDHSIRIESVRFLPFDDVIEFPGMGEQRTLNVQLVPRWAEVTVNSEPPGAAVYAGEEELGITPAVVELFEGTHNLSVVREGFKAWDGSVTVEPNVATELPLIELEEADARLRVNSIPRGANVMVNGRYRGQSPLTLDLLPDIDYEVGLSKAGYGSTTRQVRLRSGASESISVDLSARTGTVTVNVSPSDASVYVDGRQSGRGTTTLRLSSTPHRIEVRKSGYETWSRSVTPRPGYPQTLSARLRSEEAVARSKIDQVVETVGGKQLRRVEPGTFMMGTSRSEQGRRANEVLVPVTLSKPFYISTHEVTNREFVEFEASHNSGAEHASLAGDHNPVASVTWQQAAEFCNWLSAREGLDPVYEEKFGQYEAIRPFPNGYRLPTEAEWVWAIRYAAQSSADRFSWGDSWPPRRDAGNYADRSGSDILNSALTAYDDGYVSTAPVGSFPANALGIYDGGGNVAEWVNDFYTVPTPGITTPLVDPLGPDRGTNYVIRGSGWKHDDISELRLSYRDYGNEARSDVGFRIVRNAE